jgi:hypothetical protein
VAGFDHTDTVVLNVGLTRIDGIAGVPLMG